ncbi:MAG: undecaprenyl/decaprenyl-phosphate alpha-N-acetylglucosaminyl 1-phosphate transferase [Myxococcaceae bacterium]|nr:undecaprenyl/decaprenyl-phosphate alpha-N-acetylglucosaminyl 1-phosphate transferase [Myxococcaceae bacterium]
MTSFVVAAVAAAVLTPFARRLAFHFNIVSTPGGRHIHGQVIPRLGGLAIFGAAMVTIIGTVVFGPVGALFDAAEEWRGLGLLVGSTVMFSLGAVDDFKSVRALHKLMVQILAAAIAWSFGFRIDVIDLPLLGTFSMGVFSLPITVFWIVGIINAVNLIDGLDGLAAGVVFFAGVTNFVVAYLQGTTFVAVVMATVAGAVLGFLFFNFNPARIFMGDSGSYFLGFVLAVCSIAGPLQKASAAVSIAVPIVALGVPIIDTLLAMVRRFLERRPIFSPDRGHIHHRLLDMGITHRRAVLIIYGVTVALCIGAIAIAFGRNWEVGAAVLGVSALLFGLIRFIGYFEYLAVAARQKKRINSRHVEWLRRVIMQLPAQFDRRTDEAGVFEVMEWLAREARFDSLELLKGEQRVRHWVGADYEDMAKRDLTTTAVSVLGPGSGLELVAAWRSEYGDVPPQMDIMLQLVTDVLGTALQRVGSPLVPVASTPEPAAPDSFVAPSLKPAAR